jgi:acid phosphatase
MKQCHYFLFSLLLISTCSFAQPQSELPNLSLVKNTLRNYHDSGQYNADISRVIDRAMCYLHFRINQNKQLAHPQKLAIVLDIDETSLSNYNDMVRLNFGGTQKEGDQAEGAGHDPAIESTLKLYRYAESNGVAVFFVTGRLSTIRQNTAENLVKAGYTHWDAFYMKPVEYKNKSVVPYKSGMRKEIARRGYDIVLNIGDQESDLKGGSCDMAFKLPNPYYYIG